MWSSWHRIINYKTRPSRLTDMRNIFKIFKSSSVLTQHFFICNMTCMGENLHRDLLFVKPDEWARLAHGEGKSDSWLRRECAAMRTLLLVCASVWGTATYATWLWGGVGTCFDSALAHDILGVWRQEQARRLQGLKRQQYLMECMGLHLGFLLQTRTYSRLFTVSRNFTYTLRYMVLASPK